MISKKMAQAINDQIAFELYSGYIYLSMAAQAETMGLKGFANWFYIQYQEEHTHAMKFFKYVLDQGETVTLQAIAQPQSEWATPLDMFKETLHHERIVTKRIYDLVDLALEERDHATRSFLNFYVDEQVEEEANANELIGRLELSGKNGEGLFLIDKELATRVFVPVAGVKATPA